MSQMLTPAAQSAINKYRVELAKAYNIDPSMLAEQFAVTDPMETKLREALLHSADFLQRITMEDVDQLTGQVVEVVV